jgi:GT2 family glycosyltransferase
MHADPSSPSSTPRVTVLIAAFRADRTIEGCLQALRAQTFRSFEVLLTDSSPDERTAQIAARFPEYRLIRGERRLYSHEARNQAAVLARGELLACLDADVYAAPDWLEQLVAEHDRGGEVIVGAVRCHGRAIADLGKHLCKFAAYLPAGPVRSIAMGPTANLLLRKQDYDRVGGMRGDRYLADVELARALQAIGRELRFVPRAVVAHHHMQSMAAFLLERYDRGKLFGEMRARLLARRRAIAFYLAVSVLPFRLSRIAALTLGHSTRAKLLGAFLLSFPIVMSGHIASLAGECVAYGAALLRPRAQQARAGHVPGVEH